MKKHRIRAHALSSEYGANGTAENSVGSPDLPLGRFVGFDRGHWIAHFPQLGHDATGHRGGEFVGAVSADKVVIHHMQRKRRFVVLSRVSMYQDGMSLLSAQVAKRTHYP